MSRHTLRIDPLPPIPAGLPGDPITGNTGGSSGGGQAGTSLQLSYYLYDHLGNTRMVFHTVLKAGEEDPTYVPEYLADYYPYGKILREWLNCTGERYLTTQHERDIETGYDYRGARFYDSDLGRFLSVDPLAAEYAGWSGYNYAADNPVLITDPTGMAWSETNVKLATGWFEGNENEANSPDDSSDNIGVDQDGNVIYNDGKDDGNLFVLNKGIVKVANLEVLMANSTQITKNHIVVASPENVISYVKSQWSKAGLGFDFFLDVTQVRINNSKIGFSVNAFEGKSIDGVLMQRAKSILDVSLSINYEPGVGAQHLSNPYNTRNALGHEKQHLIQALRAYHQDIGWHPRNRAEIELEAIRIQRTLPSWPLTTSGFKQSVLNYENRLK